MLSLDEYQALVRADAREAAERSLRDKFGRLSNRRILRVLRPVADRVDELQGRTDTDLLDDWFVVFTLVRRELQNASHAREPESGKASVSSRAGLIASGNAALS